MKTSVATVAQLSRKKIYMNFQSRTQNGVGIAIPFLWAAKSFVPYAGKILEQIYVAKARAEAMRRNIDEAGQTATVWSGKLESKTTICPNCGKPAGSGKFCNNCGNKL